MLAGTMAMKFGPTRIGLGDMVESSTVLFLFPDPQQVKIHPASFDFRMYLYTGYVLSTAFVSCTAQTWT